MATQTRPFVMTGAALASVAAMAAAAPAVVPGHLAGLPTPLSLSQAQVELTALADISIQGAIDAFTNGFGGFIGADDPYFPGFANDALLTGFQGVGYYLVDQALEGIVPFNLDKYFFEVGSQNPSNFVFSGATAAAFVGASEVFGADSLPAQFLGSLITGTSSIGDAIVALTAGIPVVGDLTSVYFTGLAPNDTTEYGTGIMGVLSYAVSKVLPGIFGGASGLDIGGVVAGVVGLVSGLIGNIGFGRGGWSDDEGDDDSEDGEGHGWGHGNGWGWGNGRGDDDGWWDRTAAPAAAVTADAPAAAAGDATAATARAAAADAGPSAAATAATDTADAATGDSAADAAASTEAASASTSAAEVSAEPAEAPRAAKAGATNRGGKKAKAESDAAA